MAQGTQLDVEYTSYDAEDDILGPADVLDSSSEEENEARGDYTYLGVRPDRIKVNFNHVRRKLLENIRSDIMISLRKACMKLGIPEGENLDDYNLLLNLFLPPTFVLKLQAALNRAYVGTNDVLSLADIEQCLKTLFLIHFYKCSPTTFFDEETIQCIPWHVNWIIQGFYMVCHIPQIRKNLVKCGEKQCCMIHP